MSDNGLTTQLAKAIRAAWVDRLDWDELAQGALEFLTSTGHLIPAGGMALTAEQWAHYQRMAADPRFAELSRDALGVMKWPENPLLPPALFPATEPAEQPAREGDCALLATHDGPCRPAPAEPAEEETKAEVHDPDALAKRLAWIWHDGWDACGEQERGCLRRAAEMAHSHYASSPVVPAPTETEWQTVKSDGQQQNPMQSDVGNDKI